MFDESARLRRFREKRRADAFDYPQDYRRWVRGEPPVTTDAGRRYLEGLIERTTNPTLLRAAKAVLKERDEEEDVTR